MKTILFALFFLFTTKLVSQCTPTVSLQVKNGPACPQNFFSLDAVPVNGGTSPTYQWKKNGNAITTYNSNSYVPIIDGKLAQGDIVTCTMTSNAACASPLTASANYNVFYKSANPTVLSANPAGLIAPGTTVLFSASTFYDASGFLITRNFYLNGVYIHDSRTSGINSFLISTLANGDVVTCISYQSASLNPCGLGDTSNSIVMSVSVVLPVNLSHFNARSSNNNILLDWATATEKNSAYFNVQSSTDGTSFTNIGKVAAAGTSISTQLYAFKYQPVSASNTPIYFQLQMVDKDGIIAYSEIKKVNLTASFQFTVSPNPAKNMVYITGTDILQLQLLDMTGKLVFTTNTSVSNVPINISTFLAGMYLLRATTANGDVQVKKLVLQ